VGNSLQSILGLLSANITFILNINQPMIFCIFLGNDPSLNIFFSNYKIPKSRLVISYSRSHQTHLKKRQKEKFSGGQGLGHRRQPLFPRTMIPISGNIGTIRKAQEKSPFPTGKPCKSMENGSSTPGRMIAELSGLEYCFYEIAGISRSRSLPYRPVRPGF
jgi:hypothetical protein